MDVFDLRAMVINEYNNYIRSFLEIPDKSGISNPIPLIPSLISAVKQGGAIALGF